MKRLIVLFAILVLILAACTGPQAVVNATLRDTIFGIEQRASGTTMIWMTHDDVAIYCITDPVLANTANSIFRSSNPEVFLSYRSLNTSDPQWNILGISGCQHNQGSSDNTLVYVVTGITPVLQ